MMALKEAYNECDDSPPNSLTHASIPSSSIASQSSIVCCGMENVLLVHVENNDLQEVVEDELSSDEDEMPLKQRRLSSLHPHPPESPSTLSLATWKKDEGCGTPGCILLYKHTGICDVMDVGKTRQSAKKNAPVSVNAPNPVSFRLKRKRPVNVTSPMLALGQPAKAIYMHASTEPKGISSSHGVRTAKSASASSSLRSLPPLPSSSPSAAVAVRHPGARLAAASWRMRPPKLDITAAAATAVSADSNMSGKYDDGALITVASVASGAPKPRVTWANKLVTNEIKYVVDTGRFYGFVAPLLADLGFFENLKDALTKLDGCDAKGCSAYGVAEIELCKHFNMVKVDLTKTHVLPLFLNHGCYLISGHIKVEGKKVGRTVGVRDGELIFYDCKKILHKYGVANDVLLPRYDNKLAKGNACLDTISRVYALFHLGIARTRFLSKATSLASSSAPSSLSSEVPSSLASEVPSSVPSSLASEVPSSVPSSLAASEVPPIVPLIEPPSDKQPACFPIPIQPAFEEVSAVTVEHDRASPALGCSRELTCLVDAVSKCAFEKLMGLGPEAKERTDLAVEIEEIHQLQTRSTDNGKVAAFFDSEPNELRNFLVDCRLPNNYYKVLIDAGWDDLNYMKGVDENLLKAELKQIHMKPGHVAKFIDQLKRYLPV